MRGLAPEGQSVAASCLERFLDLRLISSLNRLASRIYSQTETKAPEALVKLLPGTSMTTVSQTASTVPGARVGETLRQERKKWSRHEELAEQFRRAGMVFGVMAN